MATVMSMHWPEVTKEQYEQVRKSVNWEGDLPKGAKFHVAWLASDGFHVVDIWDSREQFEKFAHDRLAAGTAAAGLTTQPHVEFGETLSIFAPNV